MKKPIQIYIRFLLATFGSALVMSIYSIVDSVCVGQYHQEAGTAALAVIMPLLRIKFRPCLKQIPLFRQIMKQSGIFFIA